MSAVAWQVSVLAVLAGLLFITGAWILARRRDTPEKRERKRRLKVSAEGRLADGVVTDVAPNTLFYMYTVGGVEYQTSQDVAPLLDLLPADLDRTIGPVTLKYSPRNPANSIVLCEGWSGLRTARREMASK